MTIYLSSMFLAFASMLYEFIFAQLLSAILGGTVLRYATMVGAYTFSMGIGSILSSKFFIGKRRIIYLELLLFISATMGFIFLRTPATAAYLSQHTLLNPVCYLPIILVGLFTGFELPILLDLSRSESVKNKILGFDYFGMVLAAGLFPLILWPTLGIDLSFWISVGTQIMGAILAIVAQKHLAQDFHANLPKKHSIVESGERRFPFGPLLFLCFVLSFFSLGYELAAAKLVGDYVQKEVLSQCLTIGIYLLGLGIGSFKFSTLKETILSKPITLLLRVESALVLLGSILAPTIVILAIALTLHGLEPHTSINLFLALSLSLVFCIGFVSGFEIPLLLRLASGQLHSESLIVGFSSFGGLIASLFLSLFCFPRIGAFGSLAILATMNFLVFTLIILLIPDRRKQLSSLIASSLLAVTVFVASSSQQFLEQSFLKTYYLELRLLTNNFSEIKDYLKNLSGLGPIVEYRTAYQTIDLLDDEYLKSPGFFNDFSLYINRRPQLSGDTWRTYHKSMIDAVKLLRPQAPKNILILGGGDGILASEAHLRWPAATIRLVDIDPSIIQLSKTLSQLLKINGGIFNSSAVDLHIGDAFTFVRQDPNEYDAIFLDFPYPLDFEVGKLFSLEFYQSLNARLGKKGVVVMDIPLWRVLKKDRATPPTEDHIRISLNTLRAAGFKQILPFGFIESLVAASFSDTPLEFDYSRDLSDISNQSFVNLHKLNLAVPQTADTKWVNSIYLPKRFE